MDGIEGLIHGFAVVLTVENLAFAFVGCFVGMLVGVLPGIGQSTGMALLIPLTYHLPPTGAVIMLSSIFYGAAYGGTITSVLMNVPGESETIVTTFDGHPLAKQGRGGPALTIAALGSFCGGCVATLLLALLALPLSRLALRLGPPEYMSLMLLSLSLAAGLLGSAVFKGLLMVAFGLLLGQVGMDPQVGVGRMTMGQQWLFDGVPILALIMGFYGLSDVLLGTLRSVSASAVAMKVTGILPTSTDLRESAMPIARGTVVGSLLGVLPGMSGAVSTFFSYAIEKRFSRTPEKFGHGAMAGVAGPETANNAFANASFLPLITLGIPGSAALAILIGAFRIQNIVPGPLMFRDTPDVAWGLIASMIVGNAVLLGLSVPAVRLWISILRLPTSVLNTVIVVMAVVGIFSVNNEPSDVLLLGVATLVGAGLKAASYPLAPAILAFILSQPIEQTLRQSLVIARGDPTIFATRPISAAFLVAALLIVFGAGLSRALGQRSRRLEAQP